MKKNPENMIKARIAETIIEEMFRLEGYQVYRFGYESVLQNLVQTKNRINTKDGVGQVVAHMPDLLVVKDGTPNFIEVKYRSSGKLNPKEVKTWKIGRILLVSPFPPYFQICRAKEFLKAEKMYKLVEDQFIPVRKEIIEKFIPLVNKYLKKDVLFNKDVR